MLLCPPCPLPVPWDCAQDATWRHPLPGHRCSFLFFLPQQHPVLLAPAVPGFWVACVGARPGRRAPGAGGGDCRSVLTWALPPALPGAEFLQAHRFLDWCFQTASALGRGQACPGGRGTSRLMDEWRPRGGRGRRDSHFAIPLLIKRNSNYLNDLI